MSNFDIEKFSEIIKFIMEAHGDKHRAFTKVPYWTHPIRTACLLMKFKESHKIDDLVIAALLHDTVEDTKVTLSDIALKYGTLVANLVSELTSDSITKEERIAYLSAKMIAMSSWALTIKLCDRLDNVCDFVFAPDSFIKRYGEETYEILYRLKKVRELSATQKRIIKEIEKALSIYVNDTIYKDIEKKIKNDICYIFHKPILYMD